MATIKKSVDVCIIGGAGAGLSAAVSAMENGAKRVLVIDKMKLFGGCTRLCGGLCAVESPVQKRQGITLTADDLFRELMRISNWRCNTKLVSKWLHQSGDTVEWLEEKGVRFTEVKGWGGKVLVSHWMEGNGNALVNALIGVCQSNGVEMLLETRGKQLKTNEAGDVTGVLAENSDGDTFDVDAKSVIIATGSIGGSKELLARFYPGEDMSDIKIMTGVKHNTGDGLLMSEAIGGKVGNIHTFYIGPQNHASNMRVGAIMRRPMMMVVNRNGDRFYDESIVTYETFSWFRSNALQMQPGHVCYPIMDQSIFDRMLEEHTNIDYVEAFMAGNKKKHLDDRYGKDEALEVMDDPTAWLDMLPKDFEEEAKVGKVKICQTLDEVAAYIGADPENLKKTVAEYNTWCAEGKDREFLKRPEYLWPLKKAPYYVMKGNQGIDTCIGGIEINHNMQVLRASDLRPIKNLYAAGVCTSGWSNNGYGYCSTCLGSTIWGGRTAGQMAAVNAAAL